MLLLRGATIPGGNSERCSWFQYMLLLRGATKARLWIGLSSIGFNTCSSCEEQPVKRLSGEVNDLFQYMLLLRGATMQFFYYRQQLLVSIHAPLARSNYDAGTVYYTCYVSIHAPLARSNFTIPCIQYFSTSFNTCSSCEEQLKFLHQKYHKNRFQYMLLLRGATRARQLSIPLRQFRFNTCSSCEEQHFFCSDAILP